MNMSTEPAWTSHIISTFETWKKDVEYTIISDSIPWVEQMWTHAV